MEEQTPNMPQNVPQPEVKPEHHCCSDKKTCYCQAIMAFLIIVLVWWAPSWANIGITVLAVLLLLGSKGCMCCKRK